MTHLDGSKIERLDVATYRIATDQPESDGTLEWDHTDVVVVRVEAGGVIGLGWSYAANAAAAMVEGILKQAVVGQSPADIAGNWREMNHALRNAGRTGAGMMAVAAVDIALWDLKERLLGISLVELLRPARDAVELYGSGGFTSYSEARLAEQLGGWAGEGFRHVKMKVGRDPSADPQRVGVARKAIGDRVDPFPRRSLLSGNAHS